LTVVEQIQSLIQSLKGPRVQVLNEIKTVELELPDRCECGFQNLKIWGTRTFGRLVIEIRCMRCGKPLSKVERAGMIDFDGY